MEKTIRTSVANVHDRTLRIECDTVRLGNAVIYHEYSARCRIVPVAGGWKLGSGVGEGIPPRIVWVGKPDITRLRMDCKIINCVEIISKVIVDQGRRLVRLWVHCP